MSEMEFYLVCSNQQTVYWNEIIQLDHLIVNAVKPKRSFDTKRTISVQLKWLWAPKNWCASIINRIWLSFNMKFHIFKRAKEMSVKNKTKPRQEAIYIIKKKQSIEMCTAQIFFVSYRCLFCMCFFCTERFNLIRFDLLSLLHFLSVGAVVVALLCFKIIFKCHIERTNDTNAF